MACDVTKLSMLLFIIKGTNGRELATNTAHNRCDRKLST